MKWDLLCTNCRGAKVSASALSELPRGAHCPSCNIDYDRDFEKNVELSFAPAPAVRPILAGGFCLSGPMATPHVLCSSCWRRASGGTWRSICRPAVIACGRCIPARMSTSSMRRRVPRPARHRVGRRGYAARPGRHIVFANDAGFELAALIEDRTWTREALTAPEVISLQAFRDLFAAATLRPGDEAGVSQVALLFSDLQGSTALYERVGDAQAYNMVRDHFALLAGIVRDHDGAVVKTIGDAVMASFGDPANAVKAALAMQAAIADHDLVLKLGVHGPQRRRDPERPARLFRLDREHGRPPAGPERGRRHRAVPRRRRRSRGPAVLAGCPSPRGERGAERLRRPVSFVRLTPGLEHAGAPNRAKRMAPVVGRTARHDRNSAASRHVPKNAAITPAASSLALRPWLRNRVSEKKPWMVPG